MSLWIHCFKPEYSFSQSHSCISRIILIVILAKKYVHFSKQFVQTAPHNGFPAKACNLLKIFSSSLKSKYLSMNISVPSEWKVLVSLFTNKMGKMLSHVVNIKVHAVSITWCKLWQQFGWHYCIEMQKAALLMYAIYPFKSTNLHITVCGIIDWKNNGYDSQSHFY